MRMFTFSIALVVMAALIGCAQRTSPREAIMGGTEVKGQQQQGPAPTVAPARVYVQDFKLDVPPTEEGVGLLNRPRLLPRPLESDPATQAKRIVEKMAEDIVKNLREAGVAAERLPPGAALPNSGWLVSGVFTEVGEGNTLRRAAIGFGAGGSSMDAQVGVSDLAQQPDAPFIIFGMISSPDHLPGGLASKNPYVVAAKFVIEKRAPDKDIERTAKAITDELLKYREEIKRGATGVR